MEVRLRAHNYRDIISDIPALVHNGESYFALEEPPWTLEGFARALGFSSWPLLKHRLTQASSPAPSDSSASEDVPEWALIVFQGVSIITEDLIKGTLLDEYNGSFTRFLLASIGYNPPPTSTQNINIDNSKTQPIQIIEASSPEFLAEKERLRAITSAPSAPTPQPSALSESSTPRVTPAPPPLAPSEHFGLEDLL